MPPFGPAWGSGVSDVVRDVEEYRKRVPGYKIPESPSTSPDKAHGSSTQILTTVIPCTTSFLTSTVRYLESNVNSNQ